MPVPYDRGAQDSAPEPCSPELRRDRHGPGWAPRGRPARVMLAGRQVQRLFAREQHERMLAAVTGATILEMRAGTPIPFVVGCGRSGTTVLRLMLNAHPDLAVPPESHFLRYPAEHPRGVTPSKLIAVALSSDRFADWGVDAETVRSHTASRPPRTLAEAADLVFSTYAWAHGKRRWGDKTPPYVTCMEGLAAILPDARFIHLIRDGRDVALSFSSVPFGPPKDSVSQAYYWLRHVSSGRNAGAGLGSRRYLEVRYEDLIDHPEANLRAVCDFIELPFADVMLRYQDTVSEALPAERRVHHLNADKPIVRGIRDWRRSMPSEDVAAFEAVAGGLLASFGYEVSGEPRPRGIEARLAFAKARIRLAEVRTRLRASWKRPRSSHRATSSPAS